VTLIESKLSSIAITVVISQAIDRHITNEKNDISVQCPAMQNIEKKSCHQDNNPLGEAALRKPKLTDVGKRRILKEWRI
jgi:hypothetical protein